MPESQTDVEEKFNPKWQWKEKKKKTDVNYLRQCV